MKCINSVSGFFLLLKKDSTTIISNCTAYIFRAAIKILTINFICRLIGHNKSKEYNYIDQQFLVLAVYITELSAFTLIATLMTKFIEIKTAKKNAAKSKFPNTLYIHAFRSSVYGTVEKAARDTTRVRRAHNIIMRAYTLLACRIERFFTARSLTSFAWFTVRSFFFLRNALCCFFLPYGAHFTSFFPIKAGK